ncbi:RNA polymerase sigma factor [Membranihabitans maritimus]|uniref:RNA polymerase sigma factor n=1 Tax=Membranihabitans maritimus TaxID=2904244 RepID=UPI001F006226|nr:RNA polymerase sigma-70 factor [Membranihabitans maritimus]
METNIIIKGIRKKDHRIFKAFYDEFYEELVRYAYQYLYDKAYSEDTVQEVFIYIWENADRIRVTTSLKSYVYRMVRNRCLNFLKSLKLTDEGGMLDPDLVVEIEYGIDQIFVSREEEMYNAVLQIVDTLPDKMQVIFRLKYLKNYQYKEIAEELAISVNTVKTQLKRAKAKINESLITVLVLGFLDCF